MSSMSDTRAKARRPSGNRAKSRSSRGSSVALWTGVVVLAAIAVLAAIFVSSQSTAPTATDGGAAGTDGRYPYVVGDPGPGNEAPDFALPATTGATVSLDDFRGESVLLYFQEGLMCQPCWDQLNDIEARQDDFAALGIDSVVTITNDPLEALQQKRELEGITSPLLSDRDLAVSKTYDTQKYGMMGGSTNGHSFILVGPDGEIQWRADYGGEPKYTMYLPVDVLLADLRAGLEDA